MRWQLIRLIWARELCDLFRDRRTMFILLGLPVLLYPLFAILGFFFALTMLQQPSIIGIRGISHLPSLQARSAGYDPSSVVAWLAMNEGVDSILGALALAEAAHQTAELPPLLLPDNTFPNRYFLFPGMNLLLRVEPVTDEGDPLAERTVDVLVEVPVDLKEQLLAGQSVPLKVNYRSGDEPSKQAYMRINQIIERWSEHLKVVRFRRAGLPRNFDSPITVTGPIEKRSPVAKVSVELRDAFARFLPFILIVWALAGALHPAIDLCAGEKERGTMETLLISPATRAEIVWGKFLTTWSFSVGTTLWNLLWLGGLGFVSTFFLPKDFEVLSVVGVFWCALMAFPVAALFSAIGLGLGVYARSNKEGQYYLMPMFMVVMPLVFWSLSPSIRMNLMYSLIPVTGVALLMQQLLSPSASPWVVLYLVPVLASLGLCVYAALRWAIWQFSREEILFREAEGGELLDNWGSLFGRGKR